jgi:predicted nucleotidyltransferase
MCDVYVVEGPAPLTLDELRRKIQSYLGQTAVSRAVLFGSFARGVQDVSSDADLLIIEETDAPFFERGRVHLPLFRLGIGLDLLVYTPEEFRRLEREGNPLIERVKQEGLEIYARSR